MKQVDSSQRSEGHPPTPRSPVRRIGLISPYTGGNLGNAAIISALVANIRKRIPGAEIVGITLKPADTRLRHGIEAFPITSVPRPNYSQYFVTTLETRPPEAPKPSRVKEWLKRVPLLHRSWRAIRLCFMELKHISAAARLVRRLDRVVVAGGGALDDFWGWPWGHPWSLFKWGAVSRMCRVPFMFVSVGKCSLQWPLSRFFIRAALGLAQYRSYRDPESKLGVQSLIDARNDPVYPDLAFSYPCPVVQTSRQNASQDDRLTVGISPMAYCDPRVSPLKDEKRYAAYLAQMAEVVRCLLNQGYRILFFTTDGIDAATVDDVQALVSGSPGDAGAIETLPAATEQSVDDFLKAVSRADLAIASRLHAVLLSHLNATPVLALSFDPKVDAHMNRMGQTDYCLRIDNWEVEALIARFDALRSARKSVQDRLRSDALRFRTELDAQYDRILGTNSSLPAAFEDRIEGPVQSSSPVTAKCLHHETPRTLS